MWYNYEVGLMIVESAEYGREATPLPPTESETFMHPWSFERPSSTTSTSYLSIPPSLNQSSDHCRISYLPVEEIAPDPSYPFVCKDLAVT